MEPRVDALVRGLGLEPHPEGGYYREVFRSSCCVRPLDGRPERSALTTILFLLPEGVESAWHRVASDEAWHLYEGGPLELFEVRQDFGQARRVVLGAALSTDGPVHTVPATWWQRARSAVGYALVGCTVGPGFDFADFEMAGAGSDLSRRLDTAAATAA